MSRTQKRRKVYRSSDGTEYVCFTVKIPKVLHDDMKKAIRRHGNTDQSKFAREAFTERVERLSGGVR